MSIEYRDQRAHLEFISANKYYCLNPNNMIEIEVMTYNIVQ